MHTTSHRVICAQALLGSTDWADLFLWLWMLPVFLLCSLCETKVPSERQHVSSMSSETAQQDYLGGAEKNENWRETMLMWERREYDRGFVLERLARRWILEGDAEKNVLHCLIKQRKELHKRHLQGWTDRAKVGSAIPSSILGVCGASLLRPNRANLPWMLRTPVTVAVVRTDFLGGFYSQWVKVYAQIWYLTADHECERQVGSITLAVATEASGLKEISLPSPSSSVLIWGSRTAEDMDCGSLAYLPCSIVLCSMSETLMFLT